MMKGINELHRLFSRIDSTLKLETWLWSLSTSSLHKWVSLYLNSLGELWSGGCRNLQLGQAGEDLQSITNMWHLVHTVATISSWSLSDANHEGRRVSPPELSLSLLESLNKSPKPRMEPPEFCFVIWSFANLFLCDWSYGRFSSRSKLIWWSGLGGSGVFLGSLDVLLWVLVL
jgi:hypothetical protein